MAGIALVAKSAGVKKCDVQRVIEAIALLSAEEKVTFQGFGSFKVVKRAARKGLNPRTGVAIEIPEKEVLKFTPSK